jgi:predicted Ser/Thr protein kinase
MPEPSPEAVEALFQQATELDPAQRGAFLDEQCAGDLDLRSAVEQLLRFDIEAESEPEFLRSPGAYVRAALPLPAEPGPPAYIGRYRVVRRHGEGGMGTVYEAEQDNPRRLVALKVIRAGRVSADFLNRFKHEAQILGRLQHPGIAQVYEAGRGEDGQPFFAMEFIHGTPLDEYARDRDLDAPARLELLAKVCEAVQHAHDKGVIHRDLKPANILVDPCGQPKVLDFGVARVTDADVLSTSSQTQTGQLLGTLRYMSPEQLAARPSGLDRRSDVYALGVILFELLAHRLPYHLDHLPGHEAARVIQHQEPSRLGSIDKLYRGDLEIIVAKALEKEKTRRYASAGDLASDIGRYLRGEAILARPASALYKLRKFARRNSALVAGISGIFAALLVGTVVSILFALRAHENARAAERARLEANRARDAALAARAAAQAETYRATLSEVKALRVGHQLGWREEALGDLSRLVTMPTPLRDVVELRSEAVATIGELGVKEVARLEVGASQAGASYLDFSPDSRALVTLDNYSNLDYWDIPSRKHVRRLEAVSKSFTAAMSELNGEQVRFLADGDVAILTRGQRVSFFGASGQQSARLPIESGTDKAVKLAIDRHCRWLAVGWDDGRIDVRDAGTGLLRRSFTRKPGKFAFSPDGKWLAVQAQYGPVQVLPTTDGGSPFTLGQRGAYYPAFAFSRDGATLAGVADRSLVLWDLASKEEVLSLSGHRESVTGVAFSPDGALVATTCGDRKTIVDACARFQPGRQLSRRFSMAGTGVPLPAHGLARATTPDRPQIWRSAPGRPSSFASVCFRGRRWRHHCLGRRRGPTVASVAAFENLGHRALVQPRWLAAGKHARKFRELPLCERQLDPPLGRPRWHAPEAFAAHFTLGCSRAIVRPDGSSTGFRGRRRDGSLMGRGEWQDLASREPGALGSDRGRLCERRSPAHRWSR